MMVNEGYGECHLAWQGVFEAVDDPSGTKAPETYDASFVFPQKDLVEASPQKDLVEPRRALVGVWQGRRTYPSDEGSNHYLPDWGYIVLSTRDLPREPRWADWLADQVNEYRKKYGIGDAKEDGARKDDAKKDFPVPREWEPDLR
jgi:hypothetical protein